MSKHNEEYLVVEFENVAHVKDYIRHREAKAQIKVLKDIKPFGNGRRIQEMINKIHKGIYGNRKKNTGKPREFNLTVRNVPEVGEFADLEQYMVTKK